jgi:NAD(P)-dependent dehydrogenase (short-subunit alcohol dehydrogenase family)
MSLHAPGVALVTDKAGGIGAAGCLTLAEDNHTIAAAERSLTLAQLYGSRRRSVAVGLSGYGNMRGALPHSGRGADRHVADHCSRIGRISLQIFGHPGSPPMPTTATGRK